MKTRTGLLEPEYEIGVQACGSQNVVASEPPGNLLGMQIFMLHFSPTRSESLGVGPSNLCATSPSGNSNAHYNLKSNCPTETILLQKLRSKTTNSGIMVPNRTFLQV